MAAVAAGASPDKVNEALGLYCFGCIFRGQDATFSPLGDLTPALLCQLPQLNDIISKLTLNSRVVRSIHFSNPSIEATEHFVTLFSVRPKYIRQLAFSNRLFNSQPNRPRLLQSLKSLVNLTSIYVDDGLNFTVRDISEVLEHFPRLQKLAILKKRTVTIDELILLTDRLVSHCPRLVVIHLCLINLPCAEVFKNLEKLKHLTVASFDDFRIESLDDKMTDALFEMISGARSLQVLDISFGNLIRANYLLGIVGFIVLRSNRLRHVALKVKGKVQTTNSVVKEWQFGERMESLNLSGMKLGSNLLDAMLSSLRAHASISRLALNLDLSDASVLIDVLPAIQNLSHLYLENCALKSSDQVLLFFAAVVDSPNLEILTIEAGELPYVGELTWTRSVLTYLVDAIVSQRFKLLKLNYAMEYGREFTAKLFPQLGDALRDANLTLCEFSAANLDKQILLRNAARQRFLSRAAVLKGLDQISGTLKDFNLVFVIFEFLPVDSWTNVEAAFDAFENAPVARSLPAHILALMMNQQDIGGGDDDDVFQTPIEGKYQDMSLISPQPKANEENKSKADLPSSGIAKNEDDTTLLGVSDDLKISSTLNAMREPSKRTSEEGDGTLKVPRPSSGARNSRSSCSLM
eukprot:TRINITY_DN5011_c0_g1_i2.p1 TRINITY_DN5011_c0_g1~~TRINITY_DN5011_c0_g1_i2.p1  ORF type:complete len:634 (+),score=136.27 TRINITY_DN5011_c0_g1_i2:438-2339(+)